MQSVSSWCSFVDPVTDHTASLRGSILLFYFGPEGRRGRLKRSGHYRVRQADIRVSRQETHQQYNQGRAGGVDERERVCARCDQRQRAVQQAGADFLRRGKGRIENRALWREYVMSLSIDPPTVSFACAVRKVISFFVQRPCTKRFGNSRQQIIDKYIIITTIKSELNTVACTKQARSPWRAEV